MQKFIFFQLTVTDRRRCREVDGGVRWQSVWRLNFATDIGMLYDGGYRDRYSRWAAVGRVVALQNIYPFSPHFAVVPFQLACDLRRFLITAYSIHSLRESAFSLRKSSRAFSSFTPHSLHPVYRIAHPPLFLLFRLPPATRFVFDRTPSARSAVAAAVGSRVTMPLIFLIDKPDFLMRRR